jgi:uncharacterized membrane protein
MTSKSLKRLLTLTLSVAAPILGSAQQHYSVIEITPPPSSGATGGRAINASGQIAGDLVVLSSGSTSVHAFITAPNGGPVTILAEPPGVINANGFGINDAGQVVGSYRVGNSFLGFITAPNGGAPTLLGSVARGINTSGQVVGSQAGGNGAGQAYITGPNGGGPLTLLGTLPGNNSSSGLAVDDSGQVAGTDLEPC